MRHAPSRPRLPRSPAAPAEPRAPARSWRLAPSLALIACTLLAAPAQAQYKVIGPDGSVTYTDRPPSADGARVTALGRSAPVVQPGTDTTLPAELRTAVQRHPVTLYTGESCAPCDEGRRLLQQRGVPYTERRIVSGDDAAALERLIGARTLPGLSIGRQPLRGYSEQDWTAYLDAAGYPRENRLPRNWQQPAPRPLVERNTPTAAAEAPSPAPAEAPAPAPAEGIRF
jgi:glutaredoxin